MSADKSKLLVIDTDCGVDDAMAILLALSSKKKCQILAITCCFGNTDLDYVCPNVMRVLTFCGEKDIPIYRGCSGSLISRPDVMDPIHNADDGFGNVSHEFSTGGLVESDGSASAALVKLSLQHPGEIDLVAIGPLSNVAMAHRLDPEFTRRLKSLVIMGGTYKCEGNRTESAEYNFYCDPEAAEIVVSEALCPITLVPWETTAEFGIKWDIMDQLFDIRTSKTDFYKRISLYTYNRARKRERPTFRDCDFQAMAALLYPECIATLLESPLAVETAGKYTTGMTILLRQENAGKRPKVKIVTAFDLKALNELRFQMLTGDLETQVFSPL